MSTLLVSAGVCLDASGQGGVPTLQQLDFLPTSCNSDGSVLFGYNIGALDGTSNRIYRWTPAGGRVELPLPPGAGFVYLFREDAGPSHTVSANGNVIAASVYPSPNACCPTSVVRWQGTAMTATPLFDLAQGITSDGLKVYGNTDDFEQSAVVWTGGQVTALGVPQGAPPGQTWVSDSSDTGDVMVGTYWDNAADAVAPVVWRAGKAQFLPVIGSLIAPGAFARHVSADGAVIVGSRTVLGDDRNPKSWKVVRWCNGRVAEMALPPGLLGNGSKALSEDGSAVIVSLSSSATNESFLARWTLTLGIQSIAPITFASQISTNGCVVVGDAYDVEQDMSLPYVWTPSIGAWPLQQYLASRGVELQDCTLRDSSCTPDGSVIFGMLTRPDGSVRGYRLAGLALPDAAIPRAPANIRATDGTSTSNVTATWTTSQGATGYKVYRSIHPAAPTLLATLGNVSSYVDTSATPGVIYEYVVRATNASGESGIGGADDGFRAGSPCIGDLNADRSVNGDDLGQLLGAWGPVPSGTSADLNGDGAVNGNDLGALLGRWGTCPP
jgi:uncharacterized membrane protein